MNILKNIKLSEERPGVLQVYKTDQLNLFAIALCKGQMLKKHHTNVPTLLTMLKGRIEFEIEGKTFEFREFDIYEIPVTVEHEVRGVEDENIFTLTQER
ncbi:cupin domain-containing protein [Algoriphagus halophilus]|uniref:Cupin type-2 domain-containing protein n=1 Tax=Algoriphagus halophilus TaxID=226505 RepID=A0A1N6DQ41_9BACT|nr:cupin domain-containing protein [Algoriphagus halophilus]SIN72919.1 hypothetical protein SAMN05444394_1253 [Algoriphagus halophilus]